MSFINARLKLLKMRGDLRLKQIQKSKSFKKKNERKREREEVKQKNSMKKYYPMHGTFS